jgi:hypothetical protein
MSRTLTAPQLTGISGKVVPQLFFVYLDFPSTVIRVHNGVGPISTLSSVWQGIHDYAMMDVVEEVLENRPADIRFGIKKIPKVIIDSVIFEKYHGRAVRIYHSVADFMGKPVDTPTEVWRGTIDYANLVITEGGVQYIVICKNIMSSWARTRPKRITDAEQQRRFPGDTAYKHQPSLEDKKVLWGPDPNKNIHAPTPTPGNNPRHRPH